jgi:hypothetical protein
MNANPFLKSSGTGFAQSVRTPVVVCAQPPVCSNKYKTKVPTDDV